MTRHHFNLAFGVAPIVMSLLALGLVLIAATTGWQTRLPDEGIAARLFQLLIFAQPFVVLIFLGTANWARPGRNICWIVLHALVAGLALGTLFYFESRGL